MVCHPCQAAGNLTTIAYRRRITGEGQSFREQLRDQVALFYANNGMVTSSYPVWMQGACNALVGLFDRVGLQKSFGKTVGMVYHPCQAAGNTTKAAHERRIMGKWHSYR